MQRPFGGMYKRCLKTQAVFSYIFVIVYLHDFSWYLCSVMLISSRDNIQGVVRQFWYRECFCHKATKKMSGFWKPYRPYFFGAYSKQFWDIWEFFFYFRVFLMIFMLFLYKIKKKCFCLPSYWPSKILIRFQKQDIFFWPNHDNS